MARTVLLMRHAKSSWADDSLSDHDRPLNGRGRRDAPRMAQHLVDAGLVPTRIVVSSAKRTRETVERMMDTLGGAEILVEPALYLASPATIKEIVETQMAECSPVMVVGHNPGMEMVVSSVAQALIPFPTACVAHLHFEPGQPPQMRNVWRPKELPAL